MSYDYKNDNWITETQAAKIYGVTRAGISYHVRKGNLRYRRVSNRVLVNQREVELLDKYTRPRGTKRSRKKECGHGVEQDLSGTGKR